MTNTDPGPAPDLSHYDVADDDAYEWLLSDHPWAAAERRRRAQRYYAVQQRDAADVRHWTDTTDQHDQAGADVGQHMRRLSQLMRPIADEQQLRAQLDAAEPDDVTVARERQALVSKKRAEGEDTYEYPPHLIGRGAAAYPPPHIGFP